MKSLFFSFPIVLGTLVHAFAIDPVVDYSQNRPSDLVGPFVLYKWRVDVGASALLFLTGTADYHEARHDGMMPFWSAYIKRRQSSYVPSIGVDDGDGVSPANDVGIDPKQIYVGPIIEFDKKMGIVTLQIDKAWKGNPATAYIHAYIIEGNHLKHRVLAKYNFDESPKGNRIYDEYLTKGKTTNVQLKEVAIP